MTIDKLFGFKVTNISKLLLWVAKVKQLAHSIRLKYDPDTLKTLIGTCEEKIIDNDINLFTDGSPVMAQDAQKCLQQDSITQTFIVTLRSTGTVLPETLKNVIQAKHEVVGDPINIETVRYYRKPL